ncbi:U3 small nucleolar RNA-associated protein 6 homolog [Lingula anatina]|uniref:U3 small nucleolar RNA-associated protein 6 homolog n=1 Tax=Lingula anatina TaxID=7574 RepID=A0A1S3IB83_LINAN|nr:U3 small nucleolar RNA-associated protein 6 homolog [Lingula anatina]|eukprot:XP_013395525.1 U3 small nucleolar RNA-associated protein 6 homolog [Lingula anatina]
MAEFVQQSIEEMLPELEQMERVKLFSKAEAKLILKKRTAYEYKLRRRTKRKEDYLQYIQYEIHLLSLVRKRRERTGYMFKREEIDVSIIQRIHRLFRLAIYRFQDDLKLWLSHIAFSKKRHEKSSVSKIFTRMLQVHNKNPELWVMAAKWEFEDNKSTDNARNLLQRGLRFNPTSQVLWLEYYRMELLYADKVKKRLKILGTSLDEGNETSDAVLQNKISPVVYKNALEICSDVKFHLSFLEISKLFSFTEDHQKEILHDLIELHGDKELTWDALARQNIKPLVDGSSKKEQTAAMERMEADCFAVYEEATQRLTTKTMWNLYITACLERLRMKGSEKLTQMRLARCCGAFQCAQKVGLLSENMFEEWVELLTSTAQISQALEVISQATSLYPRCVKLWMCHLNLAITTTEDNHQLHNLFQKALSSVDDQDALPIWNMFFQWGVAVKMDKMDDVLQNGINMCKSRDVVVSLKVLYLEWAALHDGVHKAKAVYKSLSKAQPVSLSFYRKYIEVISSQSAFKMKTLRSVYEDALREYGTHDTDLWLDYISLELNHCKGEPENASKLHWRAMKTLDGQLTEKFIAQYTLLQTGHA